MNQVKLQFESLQLHPIFKNNWIEAKVDVPKNGLTRQQVKTSAELLGRRLIQMNPEKFQDADILVSVLYEDVGKYYTSKSEKLSSFNYDVYNIKEEYNGIAKDNVVVRDKISKYSLIIRTKK